MNIDKIVDLISRENTLMEAVNFSNLQKIIDQNKTGKFDFMEVENRRLEQIEKKAMEVKNEINAEKAKGTEADIHKLAALREQLKKLKKEYGAKGAIEANSKKSDNPSDSVKLKEVNKLKAKIYKEIVEFCNITGGVGIHGDTTTKNQVSTKKYVNSDGETERTAVGVPSREEISGVYQKLLKDAEALQKLEYGWYNERLDRYINSVGRKYFKEGQQVSVKLLKAIKSIDIDDLNWDEKRRPVNAKVLKDRAGYSQIKGFSDDEVKKMGKSEFISKALGPQAKFIGWQRYNPEVYETLFPFLQELRKSMSITANLETFVDTDLLSNNEFKKDERSKRMNKILDDPNSSDEEFDKQFANARKTEQALDMAGKAKDVSRDEEGKIKHDEYNGARKATKLAQKSLYKQDGQTATKGFFSSFNIPGLNVTRLKKAAASWKEKDAKHTIKIYGAVALVGDSAGLLIFAPKELCPDGKPIEGQPSYEGLYAFQISRSALSTITGSLGKFVEDKRTKGRVKSEWKQAVDKVIGFDKAAKSSINEEATYFDY